MAGHPPIGRPSPGDPASAREQRGMAGASEELKAEMLELNLAYQERFGHVFLICATGRTGEQMRDAAAGADRQHAGAGARDRPHRTGQDQPYPARQPRTRKSSDRQDRA